MSVENRSTTSLLEPSEPGPSTKPVAQPEPEEAPSVVVYNLPAISPGTPSIYSNHTVLGEEDDKKSLADSSSNIEDEAPKSVKSDVGPAEEGPGPRPEPQARYYGGDMYYSGLELDYRPERKLCIDVGLLEDGRLTAENIKATRRLAEILDNKAPVKFIYLGSGFDFDRKQVTLPAMKMILTKYNVSPLYLDGGPIPHLGGVGVGVRSKTVFSDTVPNVITGYHVWYKVPLRVSLWTPGPPEEGKYDPFADPAYPKNPGDTIIPLNTRVYMAYDHTSKTSMNIMYQPYGSECIPALRDFLSFSERLDMDCDPFGVHLIYVGRATADWRKVIQDITNELTHYERESLAATEMSSLNMTRQLHSLAIVTARMRSEVQISIDITQGVAREHNHFYDLVLKDPERLLRPAVYHRLQSAFQNSAETFKALLVEVTELEDRIRNCINLLFHTVNDHSNKELRFVTKDMATNSESMALMARHSREEGLVMTEIAKDTKRDSNAMRTISLVTMFYLPGAFITSLFGMQLLQINGDPGHETISLAKPWPIFVILLVCMTAATFTVSFVWMWWDDRKAMRTLAQKRMHQSFNPQDTEKDGKGLDSDGQDVKYPPNPNYPPWGPYPPNPYPAGPISPGPGPVPYPSYPPYLPSPSGEVYPGIPNADHNMSRDTITHSRHASRISIAMPAIPTSADASPNNNSTHSHIDNPTSPRSPRQSRTSQSRTSLPMLSEKPSRDS